MSRPKEWVFVSPTKALDRFVNLDHIVSIEPDQMTDRAVVRTSDGRTVHTDMTVNEFIVKIHEVTEEV